MKKERWVDSLTHATRVTMVVCGALLVLTAAATVFLMLFPIKKEDHPTVVTEPARHTEFTTTTVVTTTPPETTHTGPHTLSTWDAGINGYSRSLDEFKETVDPLHTTTDPRLYREETLTLSTTTTAATTADWQEVTTADPDTPTWEPSETTRPETTTVTVQETELTAPPLPAEPEPVEEQTE